MFNFFKKKQSKLNPVVLVIYDGWGLAPPSKGNAITQAKTPNMDSYYGLYPHGQLIASGESVGLPAGEVGNSEVGHLTVGVGRVIYQSLKRINISIKNGEFYENSAINSAVNHAIHNKSNLHIMGLISSGKVHSSVEHLYAMLQFCKSKKFERVYLHLFTDGRDAPPNDGLNVISQIQDKINLMKIGKIASLTGRYFAMDRDGRWERINRIYNLLTLSKGITANDPITAIKASYAQGKTDEFVEPTIITSNGYPPTISDNDACVFFNFRVDRARELTMAFTMPDFEKLDLKSFGFEQRDRNKNLKGVVTTFAREKIVKNLFFVTMTEYQKGLPVSAIAFPPQTAFPNSLSEILSKNNLLHFHLAESEKERMVTYYFRGMSSEAFAGEDVLIVPSPDVATYDKKPEMSIHKLVKEFKKAIGLDIYSFIVLNFANPDMVAHSGSLPAATKAIEHVDKAVGEIVTKALSVNGTVIISADHGNVEELLSFENSSFYYTTEKGDMNTDHSFNPVPVLIINKHLQNRSDVIMTGTLADIAPTILGILKLPVPKEMEGKNLLVVSNK